MNKRVSISVFMTVRNAKKYIADTITSVLAQSYDGFEFIIVDDGSTDNTVEIIKTFSERDSRIVLILSGGVGRAKALNLAVSHCKFPLLANIDADDPWNNTYLETKEAVFSTYKNIEILFSSVKLINHSIRGPYSTDFTDIKTNLPLDRTSSIILKNDFCHSAFMARRHILNSVGGYDESLNAHLDFNLYQKMYLKNMNLFFLDENLGYKRVHSEQSFEAKKRLGYLVKGLKLQIDFLKAANSKKYIPIALIKFVYGVFPSSVRGWLSSVFLR